MNTYQCKCGWQGTEDELISTCTFHATQLEPAEYECSCPDCGGAWDDMCDADLCISCENEFAIADLELCMGCQIDAAEYAMDQR